MRPGNPLLLLHTVVQITISVHKKIKANSKLHSSEKSIENSQKFRDLSVKISDKGIKLRMKV